MELAGAGVPPGHCLCKASGCPARAQHTSYLGLLWPQEEKGSAGKSGALLALGRTKLKRGAGRDGPGVAIVLITPSSSSLTF